jgi:polysaccharide biosynthesis/export protein
MPVHARAGFGLLTRALYLCAALFFCALIVCAQERPAQPQQPPQQPEQQPPQPEPVPQEPAGAAKPAAPVDPATYKIGAEDVLKVHVWKEPELSPAVVVRPDGWVSLPLIGEIHAAGLTPNEMSAKVTEALAKYLNRPQVLVSVQDVRSKKYYITGKIGRNGAVPLIMPTTIMQAVSSAGGFREFAKTNKIVILRGDQRYKFNYKEVVKGKNMEQNILLQDGDYIIVP